MPKCNLCLTRDATHFGGAWALCDRCYKDNPFERERLNREFAREMADEQKLQNWKDTRGRTDDN